MIRGRQVVVGLAGAVAMAACTDGAIVAPGVEDGPRRLLLGGSDLAIYAPQAAYPLYAGGGGEGTGTQVGVVRVSHTVSGDLATFSVTYDLFAGYCATETHLEIGLQAAPIGGRNGNPSPGQFGRKGTHACVPGADITYSGIQRALGTDNAVVIAAHAVVQGSGGVETVVQPAANFASGTPGLPVTISLRRNGDVGSFTAIPNRPVSLVEAVANNPLLGRPITQFWNEEIVQSTGFGRTAQSAADGAYLLNTAGARWVWEAPYSDQSVSPGVAGVVPNPTASVQGAVLRMNASVNVAVPTTGIVRITCDNGYKVVLNGDTLLANDGSPAGLGNQLSNTFNLETSVNGPFVPGGAFLGDDRVGLRQGNVNYDGWQSVQRADVSLRAGANNLTVWAVNEYMNTDDRQPAPGVRNPLGDRDLNPAGCLFGLQVNEVREPGGPPIGNETAWGALTRGQGFTGSEGDPGNFPGSNWASYIIYRVR